MSKKIRRSLRKSAVLALVITGTFTASFRALAQANTGGSLRGTITDPTGAGLPGGSATLTNLDTAAVYKGDVNKAGEYLFSAVPPGRYGLVVDVPGFAEKKYTDVVINLNQVQTMQIPMTVSSTAQTVEVNTEAEKIVTQETSVTGLFTANQIANLPLNGRDYQNLIYLSPGVTRAASSTGQGSGVVAAGTRPTNNNYLIDGTDNNDPVVPFSAAGGSSGQIGAVPLDEVAEFTVISANGSAEFGRSSGAVVNVVTKSGTNTVHGTVFEFFRNPVLDTRQWFDPTTRKTGLQQNDFGGRFGLPIWRDHFFMAGAYEGYRQRESLNSTLSLPTTEAINAITDPALQALYRATFPAVSNGGVAVTAGNWQNPGVGFTTKVVQLANPLDGDTGFVRFDANWSSRHQSFLTGSIANIVANGANTNAVPFAGYGNTQRPYHFVLGDNFAVNPHLINSGHLAFQRTAYSYPGEIPSAALLASGMARTGGPYAGQAYSASLGSPNGVPDTTSLNALYNNTGVSSNFPQGRASNTITGSDVLTYQRGKHEFKAGFELRRIQENGYFSPSSRPIETLNDGTFNGFVTGALSNQQQYFFLTGSSDRGFRQLEQGYFVSDSWRATPQLTVEFGARYEIFPAFSESKNLINNAFVLDANNRPEACTSLPFGTGMSSVALVNPTNYGIKAFCTDYNNVGPRVGFAYDVRGNGNTVVRAGYGVYYDRIFDNVYGNTRFNAPQVAPIVSTGSSAPPIATFDGSQASGVISTTQVYSVTAIDPHLRTPYTHHFNLAVSQQLDPNTSFTIGYVGSLGFKLFATENPNYGTTFPVSFRPTNAALGGVLRRSQSDIAAGIIRGPFSSFSYRTSNATSNFHSLEVTVRRRMAHGFSGQLAYTLAHSMDTISDEIAGGTDSANPQATYDNLLAPYLAPGTPCKSALVTGSTTASTISSDAVFLAAMQCVTGNPALTLAQATPLFVSNYTQFRAIGNNNNYGDSAFDVRQRLAVSALYALPFGRGQAFAGNANGVLDQFIGGWNLTSTVDTQTGTPFIVFTGVDANRDGNTNDRAVLNSYTARNPGLTKSFATATPVVSEFQCTGSGVDVTRSRTCADGSGSITFNQGIGLVNPVQRMHRGVLREPGLFNWDMEVFKNFKIHNENNLRFSMDAFNVLNHANFQTLSSTLTSSTFGRSLSERAINNTYTRQFQAALKYQF